MEMYFLPKRFIKNSHRESSFRKFGNGWSSVEETLESSWLRDLLSSFLIFDQFSCNVRKRKTTSLISQPCFYFHEVLKGIVFQLELNAFLITCLFILKSEESIINCRSGVFLIFAVPWFGLRGDQNQLGKTKNFLGVWTVSYRDINTTSWKSEVTMMAV